MKKPRSKSEEKRQQILDSATLLFTERGFADTSMDQVAKQAEVSKQTVYSHFGGKDELFTAAIERRCVASDLKDLEVSDDQSARTILQQICARFVDLILSEDVVRVHRVCVSQAVAYPEVARLFYKAGPQQTISEVARVLEQLDARGDLVVDDSRYAATQLLLMLKGEARMRIEYNVEEKISKTEIESYTENCLDMFLRAYSSR
ncbi:MAG: TetR/AcrR family transcriptional regulator [Motiliproteus sp.]|nr:TetR/AcrR family transcriptional regulator [Motiliproteus sp.]